MAQMPSLVAFNPNTTILSADTNSNNTTIRSTYNTHDSATSGVHGVTGDFVGTTDTQTLTNKTLTAPTINGGTLSGSFTLTTFDAVGNFGLDGDLSLQTAHKLIFDGDDDSDTYAEYFAGTGTEGIRLYGNGSIIGTIIDAATTSIIDISANDKPGWLKAGSTGGIILDGSNSTAPTSFIKDNTTAKGVQIGTNQASSFVNVYVGLNEVGSLNSRGLHIYQETTNTSNNAVLSLRNKSTQSSSDTYLLISDADASQDFAFGWDKSSNLLRLCQASNLGTSSKRINFDFGTSTSNVTDIGIINPTNSAGEDSKLTISVGGSSAGDPYIKFTDGNFDWSIGVDNSVGNNNFMICDADGIGSSVKIFHNGDDACGINLGSRNISNIITSENIFAVYGSTDTIIQVEADGASETAFIQTRNGTNTWSFGTAATGSFYINDNSILSPTLGRYMTITTSGEVFFEGIDSAAGDADMRYNSSTGEMTYQVSSIRYKTNLRDLEVDSDKLFDLKVLTYDREKKISGLEEKRKTKTVSEFGMIAEEVEKIIPDIVYYNKSGQVEGYNKSDLVPLIIDQIQKLNKRIKILEDK